jgi:hypothetical protein
MEHPPQAGGPHHLHRIPTAIAPPSLPDRVRPSQVMVIRQPVSATGRHFDRRDTDNVLENIIHINVDNVLKNIVRVDVDDILKSIIRIFWTSGIGSDDVGAFSCSAWSAVYTDFTVRKPVDSSSDVKTYAPLR